MIYDESDDIILLSMGWARLWSVASTTGFFAFNILLIANLLDLIVVLWLMGLSVKRNFKPV